ncbi:outer membrane beta-barrel protein [Inquilinus sp. CAU 1745]|uniref:outer membrane beta-barrel protein n=1 Tax=Inquilinus sp. CAU 1745 TaxID=3140369 RepID=UPI00325BDC6A
MKKLILAAAIVAAPTMAMAQSAEPMPERDTRITGSEFVYGGQQGDWEATLSGTGGNNQDFNAGSFGIAGSLGYYVTDAIMLNLRQSLNYSDFNNGTNVNGSTRLGALYNFDLGAWKPWVGANIGYIYGDGVSESFIAGPEVGVRYYVNPKTFIFGQAEYQFLFDDAGDADSAIDDGTFAYNLGVGFNF